jgi:hypothetical protein
MPRIPGLFTTGSRDFLVYSPPGSSLPSVLHHCGVVTPSVFIDGQSRLSGDEHNSKLTKIVLQKHLLVPNTPRSQDSPVLGISHLFVKQF